MNIYLQSINKELWHIITEGSYEAKVKNSEMRDKLRRQIDENDRRLWF